MDLNVDLDGRRDRAAALYEALRDAVRHLGYSRGLHAGADEVVSVGWLGRSQCRVQSSDWVSRSR